MYTEETPAPGGDETDTMDRVFSPGCADAPHEVYAELLAKCPVSRQTGMFGNDVVMISRYEDVLWALKHPQVFSSKGVVDIGGEYPLIPLSVDPPEHAKYRRLLDPEFSPKKMAELEDEMRKFVNEAIDLFIDRGECDFHEDFASPLPSTFFLALTGLPHEDLPRFLKWRDDTIRPQAPTFEEGEQIRHAAGEAIEEYFESSARREATQSRRPLVHPDGQRNGRRAAADACRDARRVPPAVARWARHRHRDARLHDRVPRVKPRTAETRSSPTRPASRMRSRSCSVTRRR